MVWRHGSSTFRVGLIASLLATSVLAGCGSSDASPQGQGQVATDAGTNIDGGGATDAVVDSSSTGDVGQDANEPIDSSVQQDTGATVDSGLQQDTGVPNDSGQQKDTGTSADATTDGGVPLPSATCTAPIKLADTSKPAAVVGKGTPGSCTGAALAEAAKDGGIVTFNCGSSPVTITMTATLKLPTNRDTVLDGGGKITLDAGGKFRHLSFEDPGWMTGKSKIVLQRMTFVNGSAPVGTYYDKDPKNPKCAYGYKEGSGGVLYVRNGIVQILDCVFENNRAALIGPDVGGGAIYAVGVPEVTIVGSRFTGNRASNGGAVGMLWAGKAGLYNCSFENNTAEGHGMNYVENGCTGLGHKDQGGAGGLSGAVYFDGMNNDNEVYTLCGSTFRNNRANELAGALFRTPNVKLRDMLIDRCLFDGNTANAGGVSFIKDNNVKVRATTFMNNRAGIDITGAASSGGAFGALWVVAGSIDLENSTFSAHPHGGLNVASSVSTGKVVNATFSASAASGEFKVNNSLFVGITCNTELSGANNIQWPQGKGCAGGTTFADPKLGTIGAHGGPTPTFLPPKNSPAVGVGQSCPSVDQRGQPRPTSKCTAGSVEP